jgi:4-hydroxy-tetrahydrodipicolinate synthase
MFRGVFTALVTPFKNGAVDEAALERLIERQIAEGVHGLVPAGTTGEVPTLTVEEQHGLVERTIEIAAGRVPVIAGCGSNDTRQAIEHLHHAKTAGADAGLVVAPYYNKPDQPGLTAHFLACADAVELPIVLYNVPGRTVSDIAPRTVGRLAEHPNIIAIKDATADMGRVAQHRALCGSDFIQLSGDDASALAFNAAGGVGAISVVSNVAPKLYAEMQDATLAGRFEAARLINDRLDPLHRALFAAPSPAPAKYALAELGVCEPDLRLPLVAPDDAVKAQVRAALEAAGL